MDILLAVIAFFVIFSTLILIHEWGHFYAARRSGVKVEEFGFGLPPRIWGKKVGETLYSLNWIPFGGFVRLKGEDSYDPKARASKRSFASKSARVRFLIVVAGVLMNFLLSWALLTVGFVVGMEPLIVTGDDVLFHLKNGTIQSTHGIVVQDVIEDGSAEQAGLLPGDRILGINETEILGYQQLQQFIVPPEVIEPAVTVEIERDGVQQSLLLEYGESAELDFAVYDLLFLSQVVVNDVKPDSASAQAGLQVGDVIVAVDGEPVYFVSDYEAQVRQKTDVTYEVLRNESLFEAEVALPVQAVVVISALFPDSVAEGAGLQKGDIVLAIQGERIDAPEDVVAMAEKYNYQALNYTVQRNSEVLQFTLQPNENGLIGVGLSTIFPYENQELSVYEADAPMSILEIQELRYPLWEAPLQAFEELGRLSVFTFDMLTNVFRSLFTQLSVPEGVAGPVGIAQLTYVFVQEGFVSLLRFMALLSLSLALLNILPFPALDGGRAFFILAEVVLGRRVGPRFEAFLHMIGFLILIGLIFLVTFNDIRRIFMS